MRTVPSQGRLRQALALVTSLAAATCVSAQEFPAKPIRIIAAFPPGGNVDMTARLMAQKMSENLPQGVVVENRSGAGGMIGTAYVAKSPPDGYTLLLVSGAFVTQAAVQKSLSFDPQHDFAWISTVVTYPLVISVGSTSRFKSLSEVIDFAKRNPGKLTYPASVGVLYHLAAEMFLGMADIDILHVPFRGGAEPITEVMAGREDVLFDAITSSYPQIAAGRLRPLAVTSVQPSPALPEVPIAGATLPGYEATSFSGLAAPTGTPAAVIDRLNREVRRALDASEVRARFSEGGGEPRAMAPAEMQAMIEREIAKWKQVVAERKLELK